MARDPSDHPTDAGDDAKRRERALELVQQAEQIEPKIRQLRKRSIMLLDRARRLLDEIPPYAPAIEKAAAWAMEGEGERNLRDADLHELRMEQALRGALSIEPTLPEAHQKLAEIYREHHRSAERRRDAAGVERSALLLQSHIDALPASDPSKLAFTAYLRGEGTLSLTTDPPGAAVLLYGYAPSNRRLAPRYLRPLGQTPIDETPLPTGSYLVLLRKPGYSDARYPIFVGRQEHWDGRDTDGQCVAVRLLAEGELAETERYVPAGWASLGGDPLAANALEAHHAWVDAFVIQRVPVTNADYLAFLNEPENGRFVLQTDAEGDIGEPDWPVMMVDFPRAAAYAAWLARKTGLPWRLPDEAEWEKAARGVDERTFPWGDFADPSWCCVQASHVGRPLPASVTAFPEDESPYGVRGMAGNVRQWCDGWFDKDGTLRPARGGSWGGTLRESRAASRIGHEPSARLPFVGFRLVRTIGDTEPERR